MVIPGTVTISGQLLELLKEHPDNEHWWEVANEDGETGFVPASYLLIKEEQVPCIYKSLSTYKFIVCLYMGMVYRHCHGYN